MTLIGTAFTYPLCGASSWVRSYRRRSRTKRGCLLKTTPMLMAFNSLYILAGMGCRYLLEFGEVSNTYNFTVPNMIVHVLLINILCLACWHLAAKMPQRNPITFSRNCGAILQGLLVCTIAKSSLTQNRIGAGKAERKQQKIRRVSSGKRINRDRDGSDFALRPPVPLTLIA